MNRRDIIKILAIAVVLWLSVSLISRIGNTHNNEESDIVRKAIKDAAVTCYAVEGAYPDSLDYLRENYHLAYDQSRYFVNYNAFASNHIPDIYVTERGARIPHE